MLSRAGLKLPSFYSLFIVKNRYLFLGFLWIVNGIMRYVLDLYIHTQNLCQNRETLSNIPVSSQLYSSFAA